MEQRHNHEFFSGKSENVSMYRFVVSSTSHEIRNLERYHEGQPVWGDRVALYAPESVATDILSPNNLMWQVYDLLKQTPATVDVVAAKLSIPLEQTVAIMKFLQERLIIIPEEAETEVSITHDLTASGELYVETTEACNFGCNQCATGIDRYQRGESQTMTRETLKLVLEKMFESASLHGMKELKVKWAGGESLLPISVRLIEYGQEVLRCLLEKYPNISMSQVVLTNGVYLTEENVKKLKQWNVEVSVSIWGLGEQNNILRRARSHKDSFETIIAGVKRLHEAGVSYGLHHVLQPDNAADFGNFLTAFWDVESPDYVAKDWHWGDNGPQPIHCGISFFRAQILPELEKVQKYGYAMMVQGLREGFSVIKDMIDRGIPIQGLSQIDYLQLFGVIPTPCGSGFGYVAAGPRGFASCHEGLFNMNENLTQIGQGADVINLVNSEYSSSESLVGVNVHFPELDERMATTLALSGGSGCPRTSRDENNGELGYAASSAKLLYAPIIDELLALETMRRFKEAELTQGKNLIPVALLA